MQICSKIMIKTPEQCHWRRNVVFIINFEHISHLVLVFLLLTFEQAISGWVTDGKNFRYLGVIRGGSRTAAISKMELFVIIVNDWKPLTIITKSSIFDVAAILDPPLVIHFQWFAKTTYYHGPHFSIILRGVILLVKLQAFSLQLY